MKHILRMFVFSIVGLWFTTQLLPGVVIVGTWQTLVAAGMILTFLTIFIQPLLKILFIPINFMTLGLASWLVDVVIFWLLTVLMPQIQIRAWTFSGSDVGGIIIPPISINYTLTLILATLFLSLFTSLLQSVSNE